MFQGARWMWFHWSLFAILGLGIPPSTVLGQRIRVAVVDRSDAPIPGVLVQLVDSAGNAAARALSDERGELMLVPPRAGLYRLRTLRIGYRPLLSEPIALSPTGPSVTRRMALEGVPMRLDAVRVSGDRLCGVADSAAVAFTLWDQARTALAAAELSAANHGIFATTVAYSRTLDPDGRRVRSHDATISTGYVTQPWRALAPDSVHRAGYLAQLPDGATMYHAPGLETLGSAQFVADHCFRFIGANSQGTVSGVAFEPTSERRGLTEIRGTVWLDRATTELRTIEFQYQNTLPDAEPASGQMQFVHLRNGMWVVSHWSIRVPVTERRVRSQTFGGADTRVIEINITGGDLVLVRRGSDTLWSRPPLVLAGSVRDSLSNRPVANARVRLAGTSLSELTNSGGRFAISGVLPGEYTLDVRTPSLDSVNVIHRSSLMFTDTNAQVQIRVPNAGIVANALCGTSPRSNRGIIIGDVVVEGDSTSGAKPGAVSRQATVSAIWRVPNGAGQSEHWLDTRTNDSGAFRLCNVPVNTPIVLQAIAPQTRGRTLLPLTIPPNGRFIRAPLRLQRESNAPGMAVFTGLVVADSTRRPVAGAEVKLPGLGVSATTNEDGTFRLNEVPAGKQQVLVRHIGHGALTTTIEFPAGQVVSRRLVLDRVAVLDPFVVSATAIERGMMAAFEEHRHIGLGHFLTSAELRPMEGRTTGAVLANFPGIAFVRGNTGQQWVVSSRPRGDRAAHRIGAEDRFKGAPERACFAQVYLDRMLVYSARDEEPLFDVNSIAPAQIEAIEYYSGPAETPPEYSRLESTCGVLVIWTRRLQ